MARVFTSKRDGWLVAVLLGSVGITFATPVLLAARGVSLAETAAAAGGSMLVDVLVLGVLFGTRYTVTMDALDVRSFVFRWRIALSTIERIEPTDSPLSSPALSLDRLRILYADGREIMVSPEHKEAFVALVAERGGLTLTGDLTAARG